MLSSYEFGKRFLLRDSGDVVAHAEAMTAALPCGQMFIREKAFPYYKVSVNMLDERLLVVPLVGNLALARSAADWPEWFTLFIDAFYERNKDGIGSVV